MNFGILECDDGNVLNGDGCSADCTVEAGYACSGGNTTSPDVCVSTRALTATLSLVRANLLLVSFSESVVSSVNSIAEIGWSQRG